MKGLKFLICASSTAFLMACSGGGSNSGDGNNNPSDTPALANVLDQSINLATAQIVDNQLIMSTIASGASPIGRYVGGGTGNKSLASISDRNQFKVSQLTSFSFEGKVLTGTGVPRLNLMVDLDCVLNEDLGSGTNLLIGDIRNNRKIILVETFTQTAKDDGYIEYKVNANDPNWLAIGGAGGLPGASPGVSLSTFVANHPNACIFNGITDDEGLSRANAPGCQTGAALTNLSPAYCGGAHNGVNLVLGDPTNLQDKKWNIRRITINDRIYQ